MRQFTHNNQWRNTLMAFSKKMFPFSLLLASILLTSSTQNTTSFALKVSKQLQFSVTKQLTDLSQNKHVLKEVVESNPAFLLTGSSSIGNLVFKDCNSNGLYDLGQEEGVENASVSISGTDNMGNIISRQVFTDENGAYLFDTLYGGTYVLTFELPAGIPGLQFTGINVGADDIDSDVNVVTGETEPITLLENTAITDIFAGIRDILAPQPINLVDPLMISCTEIAPPLVIEDNCADEITFILSTENLLFSDSCETRIKRTFLVTDDCGNLNSICQTIIQRDLEAPIISNVSDTLVLCPDQALNIPNPTVTDDCDVFIDTTMTEQIVTIDQCEYQIVRTFTATDNCGNLAETTQTITVKDTAAVTVISEPSDATFECNIGALEMPVVQNSCGENVPLLSNMIITQGPCINRYTAEIMYISEDPCYDYSFTQNVTISDDTAPTLVGTAPSDITIECGEPIPDMVLEFTDNCGGDITQTPNVATTDLVCGSEILQSVSAVDVCGNETLVARMVTIVDTTMPVLSGVPDDMREDCDGTTPIPTPATVTANDSCDGVLPVSMTEVTENMPCAGAFIITRTWSATDDCGNVVEATQEIMIGDDGDPIIMGVPADVTVECALPAVPVVTTSDLCSTVVLTFDETTPVDVCQDYQVVRTWTATDDCGNIATESQTITVEIAGPTMDNTTPVELTFDCTDAIPVAIDPTFTNGCFSASIVNFTETRTDGICDQEYTLLREWTVEDICGNNFTMTQTVNVEDNTEPTLVSGVTDTLVLCIDDVVNVPAPVFMDECGAILPVTMDSGIVPIDDCEYQVHQLFTASDLCGNSANLLQIITVKDTADVTIISEPADVNFDCTLGTIELPVIQNSCGEVIPLTSTSVVIAGSCDDEYTTQITYTSDDDCYNYSFTQNITISNDTPPTLTSAIPDDITIQCGQLEPALNLTFTDDCGGQVNQTPSSVTTDLACGFEILQSITATDVCGNELVVSRTITVIDAAAPILLGVPADSTADCDGTANIPAPANVTAVDNCDTDIVVSFSETTQDMACEGTYMIIRTWTATDDCGNTVSDSQQIMVGDDGPPSIIGVPANQMVSCELPPVPTVTAADNCSDVNLDFSESTPTNICQDYQVIRTWTATDACGNVTTATQTITVEITGPTFNNTFPTNLVFECDETIPDPETNTDFTPGCYDAAITNFEETRIDGDCAQEYSLLRTWTLEDICGNSFSMTQTVNVVDTTAPVLTIVEPTLQGLSHGDSIYIECDAMISLDSMGATAVDNCDPNLSVCFIETGGEILDCTEDGYRQHMICGWKVEDDCGNRSEILINFFIIDNTAPMLFGVPNDYTGSCADDVPIANVSAMDNCEFVIDVDFEETSSGEDCNLTIIRTWTATDDCGNSTVASQTINLSDNEVPSLVGVPSDITLSCTNIEDLTPPNVTATDDCAENIDVDLTETQSGQDCGEITITRVWTVSDLCGNTISETQIIFITDDEAPILSGVPDDVTITCSDLPTAPNVTVADDCDNDIVVEFTETPTGNACTNRQVIRTWTATDDCGNTISQSQIINITDDQAPTLSGVPDDVTLDCTFLPTTPNVTVADDCDDDIQIDFSETSTGENCMNRQFIRTWTASDNCGNTISETQIISISDTEAPVLAGIPDDVTIECDAALPSFDVTATDNCSLENIPVEYNESEQAGSCSSERFILRTWTAVDDCGNTSTETQTITVLDTTSPTFSGINTLLIGVPNNGFIYVDCNNVSTFSINDIGVNDNCDTNPIVDLEETSTSISMCESITKYTWTATDNCGNSSVFVINVQIEDTTPPTFNNIPTNTTADCTQMPSGSTVTATDNCDANVEVTFVDNGSGQDCNDLQIIRTFTATDECGNTSTATQIISVVDNEAPTLSDVPADVTVECDDLPSATTVQATDDCDSDVDIQVGEIVTNLSCVDNYIIVRTWTAIDDCGNMSVGTQTITVEDTTAPIFIGVPQNTTADCDNIPTPPTIGNEIKAADNCATNSNLTLQEELVGDMCTDLQLIRTWTATDNCGNEATASQIITLTDNTAPVLVNVPGDLQFECTNGDIQLTTPTATDNCDENVQVEVTENQVDLTCGYVIIRTFTATDECGNTSTASQSVTVNDTTAPVLPNIPSQINLECDEEIPTVADIQATDECSDVTISVEENIEYSSVCANNSTITRVYTATDACGNTSTANQIINVADSTAPNIGFNSPDLSSLMNGDTLTIECDNLLNLNELIIIEDNCDDNPNITFTEDITTSEDCAAEGYLVLMYCEWIAVDACGNSATYGVYVKIVDETAPIFDCPADLTINLTGGETIPLAVQPSIFDNCTDNFVVDFNEINNETEEECGYTIERTWTTADECENIGTCTQLITIEEICECPEVAILDTLLLPATCAGNDGSITLNVQDAASYNYFWLPNLGTPNEIGNGRTDLPIGEYFISITPIGLDTCETKIYLTIEEDCDPCVFEYFEEDTIFVNPGTTEYCAPISQMDLSLYDILLDGAEYNPPAGAVCAMDTIIFYTVAVLVGQGNQPPYFVESWVHPNGIWSGTVNSMTELVEMMNTLDPEGEWIFNDITSTISGGNSTADYGNFVITHLESNITATMQTNYTGAAFGMLVPVTLEESILVVDSQGCSDTLVIIAPINIVPQTTLGLMNIETPYEEMISEICMDLSELSGQMNSIEIIEEANHGYTNILSENCVSYMPDNGYSGEDSFTVLICDENTMCDTTKITINVLPLVVEPEEPCDIEIFSASYIEILLVECDDLGRICLNIEESSVPEYDISLNGAPYTGSLIGCSFDTTYSYTVIAIPDFGANGPYMVDNWTVNNNNYSGAFQDAQALNDSLNIWDTTGNWALSGNSIVGGNPSNNYSAIRVTQTNTGASAILEGNMGTEAMGIAIEAERGEHEIIFTHNATGCADTTLVHVYCSPNITTTSISVVVELSKTDSLCIDYSELPGNPISLTNMCLIVENEIAELNLNEDLYCLTYKGIELGNTEACLLICDDYGFCDTTHIQIEVIEPILNSSEAPIANDDNETMLENEFVEIDILSNDILNGALISNVMLNQPNSGTAEIMENIILYVPEPDNCEDVTFSYEICNDFGCDEAEVNIHYVCDEVIVFNGFSPNGDYTNETLTIIGIERYPNNKLIIYNRWGNEVLNQVGYQNDWEGKHDGKDLPDGTYFYMFDTGEGEVFSGYLSLNR